MGMGSGKGKAPKTAEEKAKAVADRKAKIDSAKAAMVERNKVRASKAEAKASTKPAGGMGRGLADLGKKQAAPGKGGRGLPPNIRQEIAPKPAPTAEQIAAKKTKAAAYDAKVKKMGVGMGGRSESAGSMGMMSANAAKQAAAAAAKRKAAKAAAATPAATTTAATTTMKKGGMCKKYARGGGIEVRGKTKGKFI